MDKNDLKVLNFRKDLMKLLKQYDYSISGTVFDDGSMNIEDNTNTTRYLIESDYENYEVKKSNENGQYEGLMEQYILSRFNNHDKQRFDNINKQIGIITDNEKKARNVFEEIIKLNKEHIEKVINSKIRKEIILDDETEYIWISACNSARGYRFRGGAYIDKDIDIEAFENIVIAICYYCDRKDIKVI